MLLMECPKCEGSGFTGPESGYDGVCGECGGQKYLPAFDMKEITALRGIVNNRYSYYVDLLDIEYNESVSKQLNDKILFWDKVYVKFGGESHFSKKED